MLQGAIAMVPEQQVCGRVVLLVIGRDLAARVFGGYIRARLRRNLDMLGGTAAGLAAAVNDYSLDCDGEAKSWRARRSARAVPMGA